MLILGENVGSTVLNVKFLAWPGPSWVELGSADVRRQKMGLSITRESVEKSLKREFEPYFCVVSICFCCVRVFQK
jgi:hypothetical protein